MSPLPRPTGDDAICTVPGCGRTRIARSLCRMHYSRARRGRPLADEPRPARGAPSGYGRYGILDDDGETVLCHECGRRYRSVAAHLAAGHGMNARQYKIAHGLTQRTALASRAVREVLSRRSRDRVGSVDWQRLEAARDPAAAAHARDAETWALIGRGPGMAERAARASDALRRTEPYTCPVCGVQWCRMPSVTPRLTCDDACMRVWLAAQSMQERPQNTTRDELIADAAAAGVSYQELAAIHAVTPERIGQIVRRGRSEC